MPLILHAQREIILKVVYYGPGLGGKTTNLHSIHDNSHPARRGKLVSVMTAAERTLFLDFLPMDLGRFRGYDVRMHICSVPGQIAQDTSRQLALKNVDGLVLVVDSQAERLDANHYSVRNLDYNLRLQGIDPDRLPLTVQYNKRDLPNILPVESLREQLGVPEGVPEHEACARTGEGVFETVKSIVRACLREIGDPQTLAEGRVRCELPEPRARFYPRGPVSMIHALRPDEAFEDTAFEDTALDVLGSAKAEQG